MATLQSGFLPCNHLCFADNLFPISPIQKGKLFLENLKYEASTARNLNLKRAALSTQNNPQCPSITLADMKKKKGFTDEGFISVFEFRKGLSFLEKFNLKTDRCSYNCKEIHGYFVKLGGVRRNSFIGKKLVVLYLRNGGSLDYARQLFDEIPEKSLPLYAALIRSYCRCEKWGELFSVFDLMIVDGILPDRYLVPTILKACSAVQLEKSGKMIHGYVIRNMLGDDVFVSNALIDLYANCENLRYSRSVFDIMQERDVVSWTGLVSAYMDAGLLDEAEDIFQSMELSGVKPDLISWNTLVSGYARNGEVRLSVRCLEEMQENGVMPKVNTWNAVISGCVHNGYYEDALDVFCRMLWFPERPNAVTMTSALSSCSGLKDLEVGKAMHGFTLKSGLHQNVHVEGSLINVYTKCARNDYAEKVFLKAETKNNAMWNEIVAAYVIEGKMETALGLLKTMQNDGIQPDEFTYNTLLAGLARNGSKNEVYALLSEMVSVGLQPNVVSFNVLINGFQQAGLSREAIKLFSIMQSPTNDCFLEQMPCLSIRPNAVTTTGFLAACADLLLLQQGKQIHGYVVKKHFVDNVFVQCSLVDMYAKCHDIGLATKVFWNMKDRNTVTWNTLISGHIHNSQPEQALEYFCEMLREGIEPSSITFMILIPACGEMEAINPGKVLHGYILKSQFAELNDALAGALRNMYERCNCTKDAQLVCDKKI